MKKSNTYISMIISLLVSAGLFLSVVHNHSHEEQMVDGIEYQITQEVNECAICASHFKFSSDSDHASYSFLTSEAIIFAISAPIIVDPLNNLQDGRAPPTKG